MSYSPVKFGGHRDSGSEDIMALSCHVTLQDHVIKVFHNFLVKGLSRYATILPSLVAIGTVVLDI